jgi:hypothetical protein
MVDLLVPSRQAGSWTVWFELIAAVAKKRVGGKFLELLLWDAMAGTGEGKALLPVGNQSSRELTTATDADDVRWN